MTTKETWDADAVLDLYKVLKRGAKGRKFMFRLYWDILEHVTPTARQKARESADFFPVLKESVMNFGRAYEKAVSDLMIATKNSDKY